MARLDGGEAGVTSDMGDWGVFWDPGEERGFVWANVDYPGAFAFGGSIPTPMIMAVPVPPIAISLILQ